MITPLLPPRGTSLKISTYTGPLGSIMVNTDTTTVHVHDGATAGGIALSKAGHQHAGNEVVSWLGYTPLDAAKVGVANGVAALTAAALIATSFLGTGTASASTALFGDGSWKEVSATVAGSDTQVQYNNAGALAGDTNFTFNSSTGTVTASAFAGGGAALTGLNASNLGSGTVPTARLGSGTANSTTILYGDGTWKTAPSAAGSLSSTTTIGDGTSSNNIISAAGNAGALTIQAGNGSGTSNSSLYLNGGNSNTGSATGGSVVISPGGNSAAGSGIGNVVIQGNPSTAYSGASGGQNNGAIQFWTGAAQSTSGAVNTLVNRLTIQSGGAWALQGTVGNAGQVLASNGSGAPPTWQTQSVTAGNITGIVPTANLGTGTASASTILYGDGTWKAAASATSLAGTGSITVTTGTTGAFAGVNLSSQPIVGLVNSTGGTDSKYSWMMATASAVNFALINDANTTAVNWLTVARSGTTASTITLTGTTISLFGNVSLGVTTTLGNSPNLAQTIQGIASTTATANIAPLTIQASTQTAAAAGNNLTIQGGNNTNGGGWRGGNVSILGGVGDGGAHNGTTITIAAGSSTSASDTGSGSVTISGGNSTGTTSTGGPVNIEGGTGTSTGGYLAFHTAASTSLTERLRILGNGAWSVGTGGTATGTSGQVLTSQGPSSPPIWTTVSGGTGSPGGADTQVQFNSSGAFAGSASLTFNSSTGALSATSFVGSGASLTSIPVGALSVTGTASSTTFLRGDGQWVTPTTGTATTLAATTLTTVTGASVPTLFAGPSFGSANQYPGVFMAVPGAATNNRISGIYAENNGNGTIRFNLQTDAGSNTGGDYMVVTRSGQTPTGLTLTATSITLTGAVTGTSFSGTGTALTALNASNLGSGTVPTARLGTGTASATTFLTGANTWVTPTTFVGSLPSGQPTVTAVYAGTNANGPGVSIYNSGGGTDTKYWMQYADTSHLKFQAVNDANNSGTDWMTVTRSGTTATQIATASTSLNFTGLTSGLQLNGSAGAAGAVLTSQGSSAAPTWSTSVALATAATNLAGGALGSIPYQNASGTTLFLVAQTAGNPLVSGTGAAPSFVTGVQFSGSSSNNGGVPTVTIGASTNSQTPLLTTPTGSPYGLTIQNGDGSSTSPGTVPVMTIRGSNQTGTTANGGNLVMAAGSGTNNGGAASLTGGAASGGAPAGNVSITGGANSSSGNGGDVVIRGGSSSSGAAGAVTIGTGSLATGANSGFPYMPAMGGAPSGAPTAKSGFCPFVFDTTNNKLWIYTGSAWKCVPLGTPGAAMATTY